VATDIFFTHASKDFRSLRAAGALFGCCVALVRMWTDWNDDERVRAAFPRDEGRTGKVPVQAQVSIRQVRTVKHHMRPKVSDGSLVVKGHELDEVSLAYAVTIHKSQGSEFPAVVIPLATQHYMLLQRNLIYTGITRGKRLLVLIGQKKALGIAVRNDRPQRRYSGLLSSLRGKQLQGVVS
jgi:ATP-dependent exoDNAse (exonuclease V) alpha subunit